MSQNNSECDDEDDGDELVLSDYSDEDDIHESETVTLSAEPPSTQPKTHSQSQSSQYSMFNMPLPDDPEFWRLVNNS
ncbi:hypothetical protein GQ42DRAFT_161365 [Ramicandelaber brevisporus]|nr:hypothetical protein GQ42DRAFT_161365 [Ramicandelaber brevisporus]